MVMITESQIKAAIRAAVAGKPRTELHDGGARGAGRLILVVRGKGTAAAPSAEFFAAWYRSGKRVMSKLGSYPTISLTDARKRFREEFAPAISSGGEPTSAAARRRHRANAGTVGELFSAYVASLRAAGKRTADKVEYMLLAAGSAIGAERPASEVAPRDVVAHLSTIHDRGAHVHAAMVRAYLRAAFAYGLKSEHDYTRKDAGASWGLAGNPIAAIPVAEGISNARNRFLTPAEVRTFWTWLEGYEVDSKFAPALRLMLATGQRSEEILRITSSTYDPSRALLYWPTTKNSLPHSIPVPHQAAAILDGLHANAHGLFFPSAPDPTRPPPADGLRFGVQRFLEEHAEVPHFVPRDCRRTWKTLAGDAGLSKDMRDQLQNHSKSDVSSRHYDRYSYLPERRAAMVRWSAYLDLVLAGEIKEVGQRESNVVAIDRAAALASATGAAGR
jgi:integrase